MTAGLSVVQFPCLQDNYGFLVRENESGVTACIDTPELAPILSALESRGWQLDYILNTHHHPDHAGNNLAVKEATGCSIIGPAGEADRIPGIDHAVDDGDSVSLGNATARVYRTAGHTLGHIVYHFPEHSTAFVGDTLFAMGCGRLFEGTPGQMWGSLTRIMQRMPDDTVIYCAHEYTEANGRFALSVEPANNRLIERMSAVRAARQNGQPTIPTTMAIEKATNPFLRPSSPEIRQRLDMPDAADVEVFAEIRARKDRF